MHNYSTPPKDNHHPFYNYFKSKANDSDVSGSGLHIDTQALGIQFQHVELRQRQPSCPLPTSCEPPLSPTGSPSSSSSTSSTASSGKDILPHRVTRNKSIITRKTSVTSPQVTCQSWEHLKSPAASFLASFASPVTSFPSSNATAMATAAQQECSGSFYEEQQGDEIDDYVMNQIIGCGGFSTVRKGYCISNGKTVAIKIIKKKSVDDLNLDVERELEIWQSLDHPNLVRIQKVLETDHATYVICDYCANGTLLQRLLSQPSKPLTDQEKKCMFIQLCQVVNHLHRKCNVVHKDIKLDNILLDDDMNIKLCDFGLAVYQRHTVTPTHLTKVANGGHSPASASCSPTCSSTAVGGSLAYCAPEQIKASHVLTCPKTDVWSLGIVLFAMFAGRLPFDDDYDVRLRQTILAGQYQIPDTFSSELADLVSHCLEPNPSLRYSLDQVMNHPWLQ